MTLFRKCHQTDATAPAYSDGWFPARSKTHTLEEGRFEDQARGMTLRRSLGSPQLDGLCEKAGRIQDKSGEIAEDFALCEFCETLRG
jgi:hypothetical protein